MSFSCGLSLKEDAGRAGRGDAGRTTPGHGDAGARGKRNLIGNGSEIISPFFTIFSKLSPAVWSLRGENLQVKKYASEIEAEMRAFFESLSEKDRRIASDQCILLFISFAMLMAR
jgi:hypothetical protein